MKKMSGIFQHQKFRKKPSAHAKKWLNGWFQEDQGVTVAQAKSEEPLLTLSKRS